MKSGEEVASEASRPWKGGRELQQVKLHQEQEKIIKGEGAVAEAAEGAGEVAGERAGIQWVQQPQLQEGGK